MFKNYLTTAWRNITRHKLFAAINVFGLSLGISACLVIFLITQFELSFDNYHPGKERIYRIVMDMYSSKLGEDHSTFIPRSATYAVRNEVTGLETVAAFDNYIATVTIQNNGQPVKKFPKPQHGEEQTSDIVMAEPQYFNLFHYTWLAGNAAALNEPYTVVLTESKAQQYFGKHDAADYLNKTIIYNDSLNVSVSGIVKDPEKNTDFFFRDFISFPTLKNAPAAESWNDNHSNEQLFVKLPINALTAQINARLAPLGSWEKLLF